MQRLLLLVTLALSLLLTSGCAYRVPIRQGNQIDQAKVDQLRYGMNRQQVVFLMGNPLIDDPLHVHRWDYIYYVRPNRGATEFRRVTLFFSKINGQLERVEQVPDFGTQVNRLETQEELKRKVPRSRATRIDPSAQSRPAEAQTTPQPVPSRSNGGYIEQQ